MRIEPLSARNIRTAGALANRVFPGESPSPRLSFWASLYLPNAILKHVGYRDVRYWVAVLDEENNEVVGTVGLYSTREDCYEARWLGWFCVSSKQTGKGVGSTLLEHALAEARREGSKILRVETWDGVEADVAQKLYDRRGLKITKVRSTHRGYNIIYRELPIC